MFDLVRDPRFPGRVNDIAVECGNSLRQPLRDAYTAGGDVPDISRVWRDTTQPSCGFSLFYEQLFALVRQVNTNCRPSARSACWRATRRSLRKRRRALMLFGLGHLKHDGGSAAVSQLEREYPGAAYVVADHYGFTSDNARLEQRMGSWPSLTPLRGSWLGALDTAYFPTNREYPAGSKGFPGVDAYLYEGPIDTMLREPLSARTLLDTGYLNELGG